MDELVSSLEELEIELATTMRVEAHDHGDHVGGHEFEHEPDEGHDASQGRDGIAVLVRARRPELED